MRHIHPGILKLVLTASLLVGASLVVTPARAASVTVHFFGTVDFADTFLAPTFSTSTSSPKNNMLEGSFTYNDSPDDNPRAIDRVLDPNFGVYTGVITAQNITFNNGYVATTRSGADNSIFITNDRTGSAGVFDTWQTDRSVTGEAVNERLPDRFRIFFTYNPSTFDSDALISPPSLDNVVSRTGRRFQLEFMNSLRQPEGFVAGEITSTVVPLPSAVILFGAGLVALVGLGAGISQQKKRALA